MMIYITAVHLVGGTKHEHIARVRWQNSNGGNATEITTADMVAWLKGGGDHVAHVRNGASSVPVGVVNALPPYLRTYSDGVWTDNLLALPRF
ncbi:hypothetical protein ABIA33_005678 [Streptacidiphilus sp. MAP12-16]|uniref:DUF3892 domain-containing protein n=1 Tax=Streptacidiphilus sp. MAP12-16 TaxID=3156300 RepID=UPI003512FF53